MHGFLLLDGFLAVVKAHWGRVGQGGVGDGHRDLAVSLSSWPTVPSLTTVA